MASKAIPGSYRASEDHMRMPETRSIADIVDRAIEAKRSRKRRNLKGPFRTPSRAERRLTLRIQGDRDD